MNNLWGDSLEVAEIIAAKAVLVLAAIIMVFAWKYANSLAIFFSLKLRGYQEREEVYLNGHRAVITKIGFLSTTFLILNGSGAIMRWASVSNVSLDAQKIERISLRIGELDKKEGGH